MWLQTGVPQYLDVPDAIGVLSSARGTVRPLTGWARIVKGYPTPKRGRRVGVQCERCGFLHQLERRFNEPQEIALVCHRCELPMLSVLTARDLSSRRGVPVA